MTKHDRHDELVALLTEIRDRLPERVEARVAPFDPIDQPEPYDFHDEAERALLNDNLAPGEQASLHALLAIHDTLKVLAGNSAEQYATLAEIRDRLPEPEGVNAVKYWTTDITEEPPRGSQVTDRGGDVWERREGGWAIWWSERSVWVADRYGGEPCPWAVVRDQAPLRPTTDEDRKRVGLPVEPVDVTVEPPAGSQVTDRGGDVWERREGGWALWWPERSGWIADPYEGGAFDLWPVVRAYAPLRPTTDEDRERVGLPVDPAPADDGLPEWERELLRPAACCPDVDPDEALAKVLAKSWVGAEPNTTWLDVARAAREHIEAEREEGGYNIRRAERERKRRVKAEADLADMTRQRDKYATQAEKWQARHAALRAGVERVRRNRTTLTDVLMCIADVLDLDDAHDPQHAPDAVTLRRVDAERLVAQWVDRGFHESDDGPDPTYLRVRAALGWDA